MLYRFLVPLREIMTQFFLIPFSHLIPFSGPIFLSEMSCYVLNLILRHYSHVYLALQDEASFKIQTKCFLAQNFVFLCNITSHLIKNFSTYK